MRGQWTPSIAMARMIDTRILQVRTNRIAREVTMAVVVCASRIVIPQRASRRMKGGGEMLSRRLTLQAVVVVVVGKGRRGVMRRDAEMGR